MKSLEVRFNEVLAELKKADAKKFKEVFDECQTLTTIETKLNCVEAALQALKESAAVRSVTGVVDINESMRDFANLFGVEPRQKTNNKESAAPIKKHNGAADNGGTVITEANKNTFAKGDKIMADGLLKLGKITEAEHARMLGKQPAEYDKLTEAQRREFDFARLIGISEADAFKLAKLTGTSLKEVSRR
ncbi:MAG TPA: hypothetical protein VF123_11530 [Candidatus Sulfotelmatobacter sp.]